MANLRSWRAAVRLRDDRAAEIATEAFMRLALRRGDARAGNRRRCTMKLDDDARSRLRTRERYRNEEKQQLFHGDQRKRRRCSRHHGQSCPKTPGQDSK